MRQTFVKLAGEHPRGWDDLWAAFVAVIREPVEEPDILRDNVWVEVVPAHPRYSPHPRAILSRNVGIRGGMTDNNLEASLAIGAFWAPVVDVGPEIITISGRGPSSYEHDPQPPIDEFATQVQQHPVVAVLRDADATSTAGWRSINHRRSATSLNGLRLPASAEWRSGKMPPRGRRGKSGLAGAA